MFWMLAAAQLSAPVPLNHGDWFGPKDVPIEQLTLGAPTTVPYRVTVRPDGVIQDCQVEASGIANVDDLTCKLVTRRGAFEPATDSAGRPTQGVYRSFKQWLINDGPARLDSVVRPDLEISVAQLPAGVRAPAAMHVSVAVDESGRPTACAAGGAQGHAALVKAACDELRKVWRGTPARSAAGQPVPSVQNAVVLFVKG